MPISYNLENPQKKDLAVELEMELARFERDTNHLRGGRKIKWNAASAASVIAQYLIRTRPDID